jgi:putative membrane protein insertion efficiency factor
VTADIRPAAKLSPPARLAVAAVRLYQGLFAWRPSPCRFTPTCSAYAIEAVERYGAARGAALALRRLSRCRPLGGYGADPVPERGVHDRNR